MSDFLKKYQKVPVKIYPNSVPKNPVVSVIVQTYQHVDYISACLDGITMQKTDFSYEILLGEDESIDGTREICLQYAKKYPDKIRLFLHSRSNVLEFDEKPTGRFNLLWNLKYSRGKYIAICEGDDYWIDPYKLQKQVNFMEANPSYSICFHPVKIWLEEEQKLVDDYITKEVNETTYINDLILGNYIHTPSVMYRNNLFDYSSLLKNKSRVADYFLHMMNAQYGKIKKLPQIMAVYRVHRGGIWSFENERLRILTRIQLLGCLMGFMEVNDLSKIIKKNTIDSIKFQFVRFFYSNFRDELSKEFQFFFPKEYQNFERFLNFLGAHSRISFFLLQIRFVLPWKMKDRIKKLRG
ncbi:glycosyltransferase family 2 protein [uncultured Draconibacterium sp.]|uniref:glycosyltransferase family 2 protein n=1 Tax=uncultured Draconibacterium sp. TaxID=1573823 RepID=UPI003217EC73